MAIRAEAFGKTFDIVVAADLSAPDRITFTLVEAAKVTAFEGGYVFEPAEEGTRASFVAHAELKKPYTAHIRRRLGRKMGDLATRGLKRHIERNYRGQ